MAPGSVCWGDSCHGPGHLGWKEGKLGPPDSPLLQLLAAPLGRWWVTEEPAEP